MKRFLAIAFVLTLALSLSACSFSVENFLDGKFGGFSEPVVPENNFGFGNESAEATEELTGKFNEPEEETFPTTEEIPTVTVSDAFVDTLPYESYDGSEYLCYHIPKFDIDTPVAEALNQRIFDSLFELLKNNVYAYPEQPFTFSMCYEWTQKEDVVSLLVYMRCDWGISLYYTYHIYADGSAEVPQEAIWELYGYDESSFYDLVAQKLEEKYRSLYGSFPGFETDDFVQRQLGNTLAQENLHSVKPYISENGDLCCVATIYSLAGADAYDHIVNLSGWEDLNNPCCDINHNG